MKMPLKDPSKKVTSRKDSEPNRCAFETSDGRRCRLPRSAEHASLCVFHSREEQQLLESRKVGAELAATITGNFLTATDINYVLGKVFTAAAQNRIPVRNAHRWRTLASSCSCLFPTSIECAVTKKPGEEGPIRESKVTNRRCLLLE